MSSYQNVTPPISLFSGDVGFSFNNEAFPGSATSGSQFALPSFTGVPPIRAPRAQRPAEGKTTLAR